MTGCGRGPRRCKIDVRGIMEAVSGTAARVGPVDAPLNVDVFWKVNATGERAQGP